MPPLAECCPFIPMHFFLFFLLNILLKNYGYVSRPSGSFAPTPCSQHLVHTGHHFNVWFLESALKGSNTGVTRVKTSEVIASHQLFADLPRAEHHAWLSGDYGEERALSALTSSQFSSSPLSAPNLV